MTSPRLSAVDALTQLSFGVLGLLEQRASALDLSMIQTRLLGVLRDRTPTMNELATLLGLDKSSTTGLVDRAAKRDLVQRVPSPHDGRVVQVRLTRTGRRIVTKIAAQYEADLEALLADLRAPDRAALTALASHVVASQARRAGQEA